jgi:hypothetical protein
VAELELTGTGADSRETGSHLEPGSLDADMYQRNEIVAFDGLDRRSAGTGKPLAALGDDSHDGSGIEPGR